MPFNLVQSNCFVLTIDCAHEYGREGFVGGWAMAVFSTRPDAEKALKHINALRDEIRAGFPTSGMRSEEWSYVRSHPNSQAVVDLYPETFGAFGRIRIEDWTNKNDIHFDIEVQPFFRKRFGLF